MHFRVSGSHSQYQMTSLRSSGGREREKADVEFKYTSATNDEETFTSVVLREAWRGFPQHTGRDEYIHGDSAETKQGRKGEWMHPCPLPLDLPSVSALLFVLSVFFGIAVSVCRLSACGRGL